MNGARRIFVDAVYLIATFDPQDQWTRSADRVSELADSLPMVTTDGVIGEFLAHFSRYRHERRLQAARYVQSLKVSPRVEIIELSTDLVDKAIDAYANEFRYTRLSLQDCISILVMRERGISEELTADREFTLAGISVLMQAPEASR